MLRGVVLSSDTELVEKLVAAIHRLGHITIVKAADRYLTGFELDRFLRANAPQVLFLGLEQLGDAVEVIENVEEMMPGIQVVGMDRTLDPTVLLHLMRKGVREYLAYPFDSATLSGTIRRLEEIAERNPSRCEGTDLVISFLPAKAGVGTSTVALNTATALSRVPDTQTLLVDMDLNSGMIGFMLKLDSAHTIYEAADNALRLDENLWPQLVANADSLDVLPAGKLDPNARIDPSQLRHLVTFARRFYKVVCLDLSGNMEKFSLEAMQESKRIFIVSTPEIPALHLARQKLHLLRSMDLGDRVMMVLNRAEKRPIISTVQIEQLLGVPVYAEFANDYRGVHEALTMGRAVEEASELGRQFREFCSGILERKLPARIGKTGRKRKFLEFFTVPGYSLSAQKQR